MHRKGNLEKDLAGPSGKEWLHFFVESFDLLCIAGFDGMFKHVNPAWQQVLGWTPEELQSRPFLDFVHPDERAATLAQMANLAKGAATISFENRYRCKNGAWKWLQWTARPSPLRRKIYAIARDVTAQKRMERASLDTLDRERRRIGRELHDGLCQDLAAVSALSVTLARRLGPKVAAESAAAREIGSLIRASIKQARELARGFDPLHLETKGLLAALTDFCAVTFQQFGVSCKLLHACASCAQPRPCPVEMDTARGAHLYRIVQEAVNNAITHGRAKRIELGFVCHDDHDTFTIKDDGTGMRPRETGRQGIGLQTMAFRARVIGARAARSSRACSRCRRSHRSPDPMPTRKRILLVEDHALMRRGLTTLIESEPDLRICAEADTREAGLAAIASSKSDLVITDLSLKDSDGLELIYAERALRRGPAAT